MKPSHAAHCWADADTIYLELPSPVPGARATVIKLTCDEIGFRRFCDVLLRRHGNDTIGTPGCPTQRQVGALDVMQWLARSKKSQPKDTATDEQRASVREQMRKAGIR